MKTFLLYENKDSSILIQKMKIFYTSTLVLWIAVERFSRHIVDTFRQTKAE